MVHIQVIINRRRFCVFLAALGVFVIVNRVALFTREARVNPQYKLVQRTNDRHLAEVNRILRKFQLFHDKMASNAELKVASGATLAIDDRINRTVQSLLKRTKADIKHVSKHELTSRDSYNYNVDDTLPDEIQDNLAYLHNFKYSINNEFDCSGNVLAVMLVNSSPKKVDKRNQIRATWVSVREYSGATLVTMFLLGQTPGDDQ